MQYALLSKHYKWSNATVYQISKKQCCPTNIIDRKPNEKNLVSKNPTAASVW